MMRNGLSVFLGLLAVPFCSCGQSPEQLFEQANQYLIKAEESKSDVDYAQAYKLYLAAAEKGHAEAQMSVGVCYLYGYGVQKDLVKAETWALKSKNNPDANEYVLKTVEDLLWLIQNNKKDSNQTGKINSFHELEKENNLYFGSKNNAQRYAEIVKTQNYCKILMNQRGNLLVNGQLEEVNNLFSNLIRMVKNDTLSFVFIYQKQLEERNMDKVRGIFGELYQYSQKHAQKIYLLMDTYEHYDTYEQTVSSDDTDSPKQENKEGQITEDAPVKGDTKPLSDEKVYSIVERMPSFPGKDYAESEQALQSYLAANLIYPKAARENNVSGAVFVSFVVEKDGSLTNIKVLSDIGYGCGEEAIRLIKSMPRWIPGKERGVAVRTQQKQIIRFSITK